MDRIKDITIVVLLAVVAYLLVTRDSTDDLPDNPPTDHMTVAVLPLEHDPADPSLEDTALWVMDDTIVYLMQQPDLRIFARTAVMRFKNAEDDAATIGRNLGADYVVDGSVTRIDSTFRVTARVVRIADGASVWSDTADGDEETVIDFSREIAAQVGKQTNQ